MKGDYDELPDGVIVTDAAGVIQGFNRVAERITGIAAADAVGHQLVDVLPLHDMSGSSWWSCIDLYDGLRTRTGHPERTLIMSDGREVLVTARYVRGERAGPVRRLVVGLRDTRARQRAERGRAELISTVAHELRSPLTGVKGFTSTLLSRWDRFTDAQRLMMLETVNADADRVTRLISELLDISRIDAGRLEIRRQPVDLEAVAAAHVERLVASGQRPERFQVAVLPGTPHVWVDPDKLDQIVANLVENAVLHGAGVVTVQVEPATAFVPDGTTVPGVAIIVSDEGGGVAPEATSAVFAKFWQGGHRGGLGLGLYITRGLVEAHGGSIEVGASASGGAQFRVVLPVSQPDFAGLD
jgi:PAS domain S-box-containing protein